MNRLGWAMLILVVVAGGLLAIWRFGGVRTPGAAPTAAASLHPALPRLTVPVTGVAASGLVDDWGDPRLDGRPLHHGIDIAAPAGTLVVAAAAGTVEKLFQSVKGGTTLYERSADGRWQYYYAHLAGYAPGVHAGQRVGAGDPLGYVGDTGNVPPGAYHLHFGLSFMRPGDDWRQGQAVNPYPLLAGSAGGG